MNSLMSTKAVEASRLMRVWMHFVKILGKVKCDRVSMVCVRACLCVDVCVCTVCQYNIHVCV